MHYTGSEVIYDKWKEYIISLQDSIFNVEIEKTSYSYTRNELIDIVIFKMSGHGSLKEVSSAMEKIIDGDHTEVTDIVDYYLQPSGQALGMRYSVWLSEELPEESQEQISKLEKQYPWLSGYAANDVSFRTKRHWSVNSIYEKRSWPKSKYEGPAYILSGELDPWTPGWYGTRMKDFLPNAKHMTYPERTHLPGFTHGGMQDIKEFLNELHN